MASRIVQLAQEILHHATDIDSYLKQEGLPQPSFTPDGPKDMSLRSPKVEQGRIAALSSLLELQDLLAGPVASLTPAVNAIGLEAIFRWDVAKYVPETGSISYDDLSLRTGLKTPHLKRILRFAMVHNRCFLETEDNRVSHSAASLLLRQDSDMKDTVGMMFDESWQAFARVSS